MKRSLAVFVVLVLSLSSMPRAAAQPGPVAVAPCEILSPTLGRPVFVAPGGAFHALVSAAGAPGETLAFALVSSQEPPVRVALSFAPDERTALRELFELRVPSDLPPRTYDLELQLGDTLVRQRHCVAVARRRTPVRLVHLSNMNIGDLSAPRFDERLIDEINLVAPDALVLTGDLVDATHPDAPRGWRDLVDFLARFEAPAIIARGDHDDPELYRRYVAPADVGEVRIGELRALVLSDAAGPARADIELIAWAERALADPGDARLTFVVAHDRFPSLLGYWRDRGALPDAVRKARLGLWLAGGHDDWNNVENASLVAAAAPLLYVRTHQSSPATIGGASGVSHYRVLDVSADRAEFPGAEDDPGRLPKSLAAGALQCWTEGGDGKGSRATLHAVSRLPVRIERLRQRVLLARQGATAPWVQGGRLLAVSEHERIWECLVELDLSDLGAARAVVGSDEPPPAQRLDVRITAPETLVFQRRATADGLAYASLSGADVLISIHNADQAGVEVTPTVRLAGERVAYRVAGTTEPFAGGMQLGLPPGAGVALELDLSAVRIASGRRDIQVYLAAGERLLSQARAVEIRLEP
ncbi:MAG: metallophosphoesterase [Phycisphaerae bacterium]|nr:metallophosphoesterase [Phycisphaerae bacterium]MCZ2399011.1 metallophosphoesterase [Phycisphaerae bacterium]NUQ50491.1 metallophosphoesterase [Phycisphaerae bacterium]